MLEPIFFDKNPQFKIYTSRERVDLQAVHGYLSRSYWAEKIPLETLKTAVDHSVCLSLYFEETQVGFTRVVTDYSTFAYVCDVYVLEEYRGKGLALWMMRVMKDLPQLQGLKRWLLVTRDAHSLYRKIGFLDLPHPERFMEISNMNLYKENKTP